MLMLNMLYLPYVVYEAPWAVRQQLELRERDADQIMKLSECCRKLETEEQKIMPFREAPLTEREKRLLESTAQEPTQEPLAEVRTDWVRESPAGVHRTGAGPGTTG